MAVTQLEQFLYQALYDAAFALLAAQPWKTLGEDDVFAVQNPDDGELQFAKITGREGDQCELTIFSGARGLDILWSLSNTPDMAFVSDLCCDVPGLCFAAVPKGMLDSLDRDIVAAITLPEAFDGHYPVFRSLRPGYYPSRLNISDICLLAHVLRQATVLVREIQSGAASLAVVPGHEDDYVARLATKDEQGAIAWRTDRVTMILDELLPRSTPTADSDALAAVAAKRTGKQELRLELLLAPPDPAQADENGAVPATYVFLVSDHQSRSPLCAQIAMPGASLLEFRQGLPAVLLELLGRLPARPRRVHVELLSLQDSMSEMLAAMGVALDQHAMPPECAKEQAALLKQVAEMDMPLPATLWF
ncbi:DUF7309 domain-containing protein [Oligosphaera ethanolica]|uniref:DUF7309 domain-containing protein n=1 Tax=Oligosphaera ethanolica TaxID=760260 RepID=A0AAE3VEQ4_9BACT|nr:hypothetical protein [Oligosphaera ethanolica]MDQ0289139.1 hypothetical protein [Oligosphaera ethanolica]